MAQTSSLTLSASTIKSWFQYRCDRKTRYECMRQDERSRVPITKIPLPSEWAEFGNDFERDLVARLATEKRILRPARGDDRLSQKQSEAFLRGMTGFEDAYQFVMEETPQLRTLLK